jgi:Holliday junction DNA helicase RuvB
VANTLYQLKHADVLFIDEGHSLKRDAQQLLYVALDQEKCPAIIESRLDRGQLRSIASFTLIVATNQPGLIQRGLRSRLSRIELDRYTVPELKVIAERVAMNDGAEITPQAARRLAEAAQGTPRSIYRRIETLSLLYTNTLKFTQDHVEDLLAGEGIDVYGMSPQQRLYLSALAESPQGVCSIERLSIKLGCDAASVRQDLEPYLFEQGFVDPNSSRGRRLTAQGLAVVRELAGAEIDNGKEEAI